MHSPQRKAPGPKETWDLLYVRPPHHHAAMWVSLNVDNVESTTVPQFMQPLITPHKVDDVWPFPAIAHEAGQDICEQRLSALQPGPRFGERSCRPPSHIIFMH